MAKWHVHVRQAYDSHVVVGAATEDEAHGKAVEMLRGDEGFVADLLRDASYSDEVTVEGPADEREEAWARKETGRTARPHVPPSAGRTREGTAGVKRGDRGSPCGKYAVVYCDCGFGGERDYPSLLGVYDDFASAAQDMLADIKGQEAENGGCHMMEYTTSNGVLWYDRGRTKGCRWAVAEI